MTQKLDGLNNARGLNKTTVLTVSTVVSLFIKYIKYQWTLWISMNLFKGKINQDQGEVLGDKRVNYTSNIDFYF